MSGEADRARVVVVDDEKELADALAVNLRREYDVTTAYGGEEALEVVDDDVDVVLLDRRMPGLSGDEVLRRLRDREVDVRVVMITAVDPGFDILDMPFDDYICKSVDDEIFDAIDTQLRIAAYEQLSEYFSKVAKRSLLESQYYYKELEDNEEFQRLEGEIEALRSELSRLIDDFDEVEAAFEGIGREA